jgi:energy-coupling factor transport system ATP-binding protein
LKENTTETIIKTENICYTYPEDSRPALNGLSFEVKRGEMVAVLGHNGSGKSTLARLLNGIFLPDKGSILIKGMDTADQDLLYDIRQTVGLVFQNPDNQIIATVVEEDVAFGPENLGFEPAEIRLRVDEALKAVGMYEWREHAPHLLSGGQKQRVAIAGVIAMRPEVLILDEPTAMLDPKGRDEVMQAVIRLNRELGMTVLLITHHMQEAALCGRIIALKDGKMLADGTPHEVFSDIDGLRAAGLGVPQEVLLMRRLGIEKTIIGLDECFEEIIKKLR